MVSCVPAVAVGGYTLVQISSVASDLAFQCKAGSWEEQQLPWLTSSDALNPEKEC